MNLKLTIFLTLFFSMQVIASASSIDGFHKRFGLVENDEGQIIAIKDKSLTLDFSIWTFVETLKSELLNEQKQMLTKSNYYEDAESILFEDNPYAKMTDKQAQNNFTRFMMKSLYDLPLTDINAIYDNPILKQVLSSYEEKLKSLMMNLRLDIVVNMEDPKYFYNRNLGYQAVKFGLDLARRRLSTIPLLNAASDIIVKLEKLIRERRTYHQNILLYYLHNFAPEELGLTKELADHAFSSVYESRIQPLFYWESNMAANLWDRYGTDNFYNYWRAATRTLNTNRGRYENVGSRLNYAFNNVTINGRKVIINLFDQQSMIQWYPSIAYDYTRPNYIKRRRELHRLVQVGMSFIAIPAFFKDTINSYIDSTYLEQRLTEGSLYAYFEAQGMDKMRKRMVRQTMNPFETIK